MKWNVQQMAALSLLGEEAQGAILVFLLSVCVFNRNMINCPMDVALFT